MCDVPKPKLCSAFSETVSHHVPDNPHPYSVIANSPELLLQSFKLLHWSYISAILAETRGLREIISKSLENNLG